MAVSQTMHLCCPQPEPPPCLTNQHWTPNTRICRQYQQKMLQQPLEFCISFFGQLSVILRSHPDFYFDMCLYHILSPMSIPCTSTIGPPMTHSCHDQHASMGSNIQIRYKTIMEMFTANFLYLVVPILTFSFYTQLQEQLQKDPMSIQAASRQSNITPQDLHVTNYSTNISTNNNDSILPAISKAVRPCCPQEPPPYLVSRY